MSPSIWPWPPTRAAEPIIPDVVRVLTNPTGRAAVDRRLRRRRWRSAATPATCSTPWACLEPGDPQLRARVGTLLLAQDQPGARWPRRQVDQPGGLGDPGPVAGFDLHPVLGGARFARAAGRSAPGMSKWPRFAPRENCSPLWSRWRANSLVAPAASVRTSTGTRPASSRRRSGSGTWARAQTPSSRSDSLVPSPSAHPATWRPNRSPPPRPAAALPPSPTPARVPRRARRSSPRARRRRPRPAAQPAATPSDPRPPARTPGLGTQYRDVTRGVPAERDRDRQVQHDLARVVRCQRQPPRPKPPRQHSRQLPAAPRGLDQQRPARVRHQRLTADDHRQPRDADPYPSPAECLSTRSDQVSTTTIKPR